MIMVNARRIVGPPCSSITRSADLTRLAPFSGIAEGRDLGGTARASASYVPAEQRAPRPAPEPAPDRPTGGDTRARRWFASLFSRFDALMYVGLAAILGGSAVVLLAHAVWSFGHAAVGRALPAEIVPLLDQVLLILMIVEILYTVRVSLKHHTLAPEPFVVVGLIAAIRRVLVLTAEFSKLVDAGQQAFTNAMIELGVLTVLIVALVASLVLLRRRPATRAERE
jgi:uncharacterized membrane protein (DUF373 family)